MASSVSSKPVVAGRLLMVDDNKLGLGARKAVLEELGYTVVAASSPIDALDLLSRHSIDVVITDYRMPDMNGTELIREMRKRGASQPVIIISGFVDALGLTETNTSADIVIQKSAHEVSHMVRAVRTLLKRVAAPKKPPVSTPAASKARRKKA